MHQIKQLLILLYHHIEIIMVSLLCILLLTIIYVNYYINLIIWGKLFNNHNL